MWRPLILATTLLVGADLARAADSQDQFQAYGMGRLSCKTFTDLCEAKDEKCKLTGTYLEGYLSGYNALAKDTFNVLSWVPADLLARFAFNVCKQNPTAPLLLVLNDLVQKVLAPMRIRTASERVKIGDGKDAVFLYKDTIRSMQDKLTELGFHKGKSDGAFGPGTQSSVQAFQKAARIEPSGIPDPGTLVVLFLGQPRQDQGSASAGQPTAPAASPPSQAAPAGGQPPAKLDLNLIPQAPPK